jgi:hypothetical protein
MKKMSDAPQGMETPTPMPPTEPAQEIGRAENMMEEMKAPDTASEYIPESIEHPKGRITMAIGKARETILGNGSLPDEIKGLGRSYVNFYKVNVGSNLRCLRDLVTLHPVRAAKEFAFGTTGNLGNMAKIVSSPVRLGYSAGASVANIGKETAKLPFKAAAGVAKSPLWVWEKMVEGVNKLSKIGHSINTWKPLHA